MKHLEYLTEVTTSHRIEDVVTVRRINAIQEAIKDIAAGKTLHTGFGIRKGATNGEVHLSAIPGEGNVRKRDPFEVTVEYNSADEIYEAIIEPGVYHAYSEKPDGSNVDPEEFTIVVPEFAGRDLLFDWERDEALQIAVDNEEEQPDDATPQRAVVTEDDAIYEVTKWLDEGEFQMELLSVEFRIAPKDNPPKEHKPCLLVRQLGHFERVGETDDSSGFVTFRQYWTGHRELVRPGIQVCSSSSSPSDDSGSQSSFSEASRSGDSESNSNSGSSDTKSTAIVKASWTPDGYTALFIEEAPEVRFNDVLIINGISKRFHRIEIDPRFTEVCEKGTIEAVGYTCDKPVSVGLSVSEGNLIIRSSTLWFKRPTKLVVRLSGIRKGYLGTRFPNRDGKQYIANKQFINQAYGKNYI